jgi:hypothetical protein
MKGIRQRRVRSPLFRPIRCVTAGIAAVKASEPRAASRACRRTRRASCSVCPGEDRAANTPKIPAMIRLMPRRMSVAGMDSKWCRRASHPAASANVRTASAKMSAMTAKAARRPCRAIIARSRNSSASSASLRRLMLRTACPPSAGSEAQLESAEHADQWPLLRIFPYPVRQSLQSCKQDGSHLTGDRCEHPAALPVKPRVQPFDLLVGLHAFSYPVLSPTVSAARASRCPSARGLPSVESLRV